MIEQEKETSCSNFIDGEFPVSRLLLEYDANDEKKKDSEEEILNKDLSRLVVKPINSKHKRILAFFAGADSIVNINIKKKLSKITVKEAEIAYGFQQMMEDTHSEVYADMLIKIITDPVERDELINAFKTVASIKRMIQWAQRWINSKRRIGYSIVVFCIFEGLMFSGAFAGIYWLKKILGEDIMKGLIQSNNLIAKDEGMHTIFGCVIYTFIIYRLSFEEICELMKEAVEICKSFTKDAICVDMIGMNVELMYNYIEYVADRLMVYLGYEKIFMTKIPDQFQFMDTIGFLNKDNFFERRATEYQKAYNDRNRADWNFKLLPIY
nr:ribonucleoside-diphosphate reductase subunit M2 B-like [Hydra vulgaris]